MHYKKYLLMLSVVSCFLIAHEREFIDTMVQYAGGTISSHVQEVLYELALPDPANVKEKCMLHARDKSLLHSVFPSLQKTLPYIVLGDLPTPVVRLYKLEERTKSRANLYIKRDDMTGRFKHKKRAFGGNKIRKLEFLLADALSLGARSVMTYGAIGSNHVVATASLCNYLGLHCMAMLTPQPVTQVVQRNVLLMHAYGVEMILNPDKNLRHMQTVCSYIQHKYKRGTFPYFIPTGGSCPVGITGFVNAAFELRSQIEQGLLPEPDYIYVAMGSMGTTVGLLLGLRAAGLKSRVVSVAVEPDDLQHPFSAQLVRLLQKTNNFLHEKAVEFPLFEWNEDAGLVRLDWSGSAYGAITQEAIEAINVMQESEGIMLDTTYTGKAFAALVFDLQSGILDGKKILFWNTFCSDAETVGMDYQKIPIEFQRYFA